MSKSILRNVFNRAVVNTEGDLAVWTAKGDDDMIEMHEQDILDITRVGTLLQRDKLTNARKKFNSMDTIVREDVICAATSHRELDVLEKWLDIEINRTFLNF
ncbi:hypothetical protein DRQ53_08640 [bacterium]|nr:MAG: hypothetical protein DRQ53_08640 [bacterium]